jgi:hypothetical protein
MLRPMTGKESSSAVVVVEADVCSIVAVQERAV